MISFFTRAPFFIEKPSGRSIKRLSSIIRGEQIANFLRAKLNPKEGYENDTLIYVKPIRLDLCPPGSYIDVNDDPKLAENLKNRPDVNLISTTTAHVEWLSSFLPNKIVHIPHQHMNFERNRRTRTEVTTCGYVGADSPSQRQMVRDMREALEKVGMKLVSLLNFETREDIIKFYQSIDIQVIGSFGFLSTTPWYHEKKIVDAMSFGIPTVSDRKLGYRDVEGFYIPVSNMTELVEEVLKLKGGWDINRLIDKAEGYHISNIAKLYEKLDLSNPSP